MYMYVCIAFITCLRFHISPEAVSLQKIFSVIVYLNIKRTLARGHKRYIKVNIFLKLNNWLKFSNVFCERKAKRNEM